jgi:cytidylate kinase
MEPAPDAETIDTTELAVEEVVERIARVIAERTGAEA